MRAVTTLAVGLAAVLACAGAHAQKPGPAQTYPAKPIRFICPYNPGGAGDIFTRTIARKLTEYLGQASLSTIAPGQMAASARRWWRRRHPTAIRS